MLQTLYQIGRTQKEDVSSLLTPIPAKTIDHVVGIIFEHNDGLMQYYKSQLFEFDDPLKYLFRKIRGGKPGLFLTGNINRQDIVEIRDNEEYFIKNKILWFPRGKLVSDTSTILFNTLNEYRKNELIGIFKELQSKIEEIANDVINILTGKFPKRTLLTIMIRQQGVTQFVGQINDYVEFFEKGSASSKDNKKNKINENKSQEEGELLVCNVCNKQSLIYPFSESPLPFFFSKKTHFFDNANIAKSFPLCDTCYSQLQRGIKFIQDNLDYRISSVQLQNKKITAAGINFWLFPTLDNQQLLMKLKEELGSNNLYYLNSLKELCSTLHLISTYDYPTRQDYIESFLRFSALFYMKDERGLIRVLNYVQGIYPARLQKLLEIKEKIDRQYPFQDIRKEEFFIGLLLLVTFYKDIKPQWQAKIISILNRMFTGQQIPLDEIIRNIRIRIHESLRKSNDLKLISRISFMGLMLLEYVINLNESGSINGNNGKIDSNILMMNITSYDVRHTEKFISSHKSVLSDETRQGIFAAGITVAILLHVQENKYKKVGPYWDKLSRLDLDLKRVIGFFPSVRNLLGLYKIRDYDTTLNYLAVKYVIDPTASIAKDIISYIFTLGLSFGYMLANKNLKDKDDEEAQ